MGNCCRPIHNLLSLLLASSLAGCGVSLEVWGRARAIEDRLDDLGGQLEAEMVPPSARSALATYEAPPLGSYKCHWPGGPDGSVMRFDLRLSSGNQFAMTFDDAEERPSRTGDWYFDVEKHQLGFGADDILDYGYYDSGARLLLLVTQVEQEQGAGVVFCRRAD